MIESISNDFESMTRRKYNTSVTKKTAVPPPEAREVLDNLDRGEWLRVKPGGIQS